MKGTGSESWILLIDDAEQGQRYPGLNSIEFQILRMILTFQTLKLSNCHPLYLKYYQNFKVYLLMNKGTSFLVAPHNVSYDKKTINATERNSSRVQTTLEDFLGKFKA